MDHHSVWFWYNTKKEKVSWMTTRGCGELHSHIPVSEVKKSSQLRDNACSISLLDLVGKELSLLIVGWLDEVDGSHVLRIYLASNLPKHWQTLPLEWCKVEGKQLYHRLQVINHANLNIKPTRIGASDPSLILNLWPQSQETESTFSFLESLVRNSKYQVIKGSAKCSCYLYENDITQAPLLCLIAHGNEKSSHTPFLTEDNSPWVLPDVALPPLVLLLACGSEQGNLIEYSQKLLKSGAKTILAPIGKLNAAQVDKFLGYMLDDLTSGKRIDESLFHLKQNKSLNHAAIRLRIIGDGDILFIQNDSPHTPYQTNRVNSLDDCDNISFPILLNGISCTCLTKNNTLDDAVCRLYEMLSLSYDNPHENKYLYKKLSIVYEKCWRLTKLWLNPLLIHLSTLHDHASIKRYQQRNDANKSIRLPSNPLFYYYLAHGNYRQGNYSKAMRALVSGLNLLDTPTSVYNEAAYKLSSKFTDICIDMNLIAPAWFFLNYKKGCIEKEGISLEIYESLSFCTLDQEARILVRDTKSSHGLLKAIGLLSKKYSLSTRSYKEDGLRELSILLYLSAWVEDVPNIYYKQAFKILENQEQITKKIIEEKGNCKELYLLKGLAAWAWRRQDIAAKELLNSYSNVFSKLCYIDNLVDSGPLGFIIAFLAAMKHKDSLILWPLISSKLDNDRYYYELSFFHAILNDSQAGIESLRKFHIERMRVKSHLDNLIDNNLSEGSNRKYFISDQYLHDKYCKEKYIINKISKNRINISLCISEGILPL